MEINATVYIIAESEALVEKTARILSDQVGYSFCDPDSMEPCAALPIERTWYFDTMGSGPTGNPRRKDSGWKDCLKKCGALLKDRGSVIVRFTSPDAPDDYSDYAYTDDRGNVMLGACWDENDFDEDIDLVFREIRSGRTRSQREAASRRKEKEEALRREKGDFEIVGGVLKKYRGDDEEVTIPEGVREIGAFAFSNQRGIERMLLHDEEYEAPEMNTLEIPEGVERIDTYAFAYCTHLAEVTIPESVKFIGERAFEGCEVLNDVTLPAGLTGIEPFTFFLCEWLDQITIPEKVERIGAGAFSGCSDLKTVELPTGLKCIEKEAFSSCYRLNAITIPGTVEEIHGSAFQSCSAMKTIDLKPGLKKIGDCAFKDCKSVVEIVIPEGVEAIGDAAFEGCYRLERVALPESLRHIGVTAFRGCRVLKQINLPEGLAEIGEQAFDDCRALGKVILPPDVRQFTRESFLDDACGENATLREALREIWQKNSKKSYWDAGSFKALVPYIDPDDEIIFLNRRFKLCNIPGKEARDSIRQRGGKVSDNRAKTPPDFLILNMLVPSSEMLSEILRVKQHGSDTRIICNIQLDRALEEMQPL